LTAFQHMLASMPRQEVHDQLGQFGGLPTAGGGADGEAGANEVPLPAITIRRQMPKVGRNDPCPCGSGKKFKKCCDTQS